MTLEEWLIRNKIQHEFIGRDICRIPEFGDCLIQDIEEENMDLFKISQDGEVMFNCADSTEGLIGDGVYYVIVPFGDNWFYIDLRKDFKLEILKYVGLRVPTERHEEICNLGCHDAYELLNGSFLTKDWVRKAKWYGHKAIGICNKNTMASLYSLQKECLGAGIAPVFGYSFTCITEDSSFDAKVFVQSDIGLRNMHRIQKTIMVDHAEDPHIFISELKMFSEGLVLVLGKLSPLRIDFTSDLVKELETLFDDVFFQVDLAEYKAPRIDDEVIRSLQQYYEWNVSGKTPIQGVLLTDSYYLDEDDAKNKIIVNKIAEGAAHEQSDQQFFRDVDEHYSVLSEIFGNDKLPGIFWNITNNARKIAEGCTARFENTRNFMPKYDMLPEEKEKYGTTHNMFTQLLLEGLERLAPEGRYEEYRERMEHEKYVIESTDNIDYLLVQWDSVNWCRKNGIYIGCGRGSAAGSLLLYLLGITLVDPIRYNLLFERFLLPERAGLYAAETSIINGKIDSKEFVEVTLDNGRTIKFDVDAKFLVKRGDENPVPVYADELLPDDDIVFDNRDLLFTINEI